MKMTFKPGTKLVVVCKPGADGKAVLTVYED